MARRGRILRYFGYAVLAGFAAFLAFALYLDLGDAGSGVQLDRTCINARRQGEASPLELAGDAQIEVQGEGEERGGAGKHRVAEIP